MSNPASWLGISDDAYYGGSGTSASQVFVNSPSSSAGYSVNPSTGQRGSSGSASARMDDTLNSMTSALDQLFQVSDRNSARSEQQAADLRDWQERQNALAMQFNSSEAAKNRDWQEMMSNTAHQREVADLQAAGLNPVLSASGGNGAAVTSGATASGVTSAGAKGETDMSTTQALVNLLGTLWTSQTQIEMQRASAENNLAIADKQAAASQLVAEIYGQYGLAQTELAGQFGLDQAEVHGLYSRLVAQIQSGATVSSAQIHSEAQRYAADQSLTASQQRTFADSFTSLVQTGVNFLGSQLSSQRSASSALDVAKEQNKGKLWGWPSAIADAASGKSWSDIGTFNRYKGNSKYDVKDYLGGAQ